MPLECHCVLHRQRVSVQMPDPIRKCVTEHAGLCARGGPHIGRVYRPQNQVLIYWNLNKLKLNKTLYLHLNKLKLKEKKQPCWPQFQEPPVWTVAPRQTVRTQNCPSAQGLLLGRAVWISPAARGSWELPRKDWRDSCLEKCPLSPGFLSTVKAAKEKSKGADAEESGRFWKSFTVLGVSHSSAFNQECAHSLEAAFLKCSPGTYSGVTCSSLHSFQSLHRFLQRSGLQTNKPGSRGRAPTRSGLGARQRPTDLASHPGTGTCQLLWASASSPVNKDSRVTTAVRRGRDVWSGHPPAFVLPPNHVEPIPRCVTFRNQNLGTLHY